MRFSETSIERFAVAALPESVGPAPYVQAADPVESQQ
jgi:hypothetical protein